MTKYDHSKGAEAREEQSLTSEPRHSLRAGSHGLFLSTVSSERGFGSFSPGGLCFLVPRVGGAALTWSLQLAGWARWARWWDVVPGRLGWPREKGSVSGFCWPVAFSCQALGSCGERVMAVPSS